MQKLKTTLLFLLFGLSIVAQPNGFDWKTGNCNVPVSNLIIGNQGYLWGVEEAVFFPSYSSIAAYSTESGQRVGSASGCPMDIAKWQTGGGVIAVEFHPYGSIDVSCSLDEDEIQFSRTYVSVGGLQVINSSPIAIDDIAPNLSGYFVNSARVASGNGFYFVMVNCVSPGGNYRVLNFDLRYIGGNWLTSNVSIHHNQTSANALLEDQGAIVLNDGRKLVYFKELNQGNSTQDYYVELRNNNSVPGSKTFIANYTPGSGGNLIIVGTELEGSDDGGMYIYINWYDQGVFPFPAFANIIKINVSGNSTNYSSIKFLNNERIAGVSTDGQSLIALYEHSSQASVLAPTSTLLKMNLNGDEIWKRYLGADNLPYDNAKDVVLESDEIYTSIVSAEPTGDLENIDFSNCSGFGYSWLSKIGFEKECCQCFNYICTPPTDDYGTLQLDILYQTMGSESSFDLEITDRYTGVQQHYESQASFRNSYEVDLLPGWYFVCYRVYGGSLPTLRATVPIYECCQYVYVADRCYSNEDNFIPNFSSSGSGMFREFECGNLPSNSVCHWSFGDNPTIEIQDTGHVVTHNFLTPGWKKICVYISTPFGCFRYCGRILISGNIPWPDPECYETSPPPSFEPTFNIGNNNFVSIGNVNGWDLEIDYGDGTIKKNTSHQYNSSGPDRYVICIKYYYNDCYYGCFCYTVLLQPCCERYYNYDCGMIDWYLSGEYNGIADNYTFKNISGLEVESWLVDGVPVQVGGDEYTKTFANYDGRLISVCFTYLDADDCLQYCCLRFCFIDSFSCENVHIEEHTDDTYTLSVSGVDAAIEPVWILHRKNATDLEIGVGTSISFDPLSWGAFNQELSISVRYLSHTGCYRYCCRTYCFGCNVICDEITTLPYPHSDNQHISLDFPNTVDLAYIMIEGPGGIRDSITTTSYFCPIPGTYYFCFYYYQGSILKECCIEYCINDYLECGGTNLIYYPTSHDPYEYIIESCGSIDDDVFYVIEGQVFQPNQGDDLRHHFSGPGRYYVCCYYFDPVCHMYFSCCTYICVRYQPPYPICSANSSPDEPSIAVDTSNHLFTLNSNGAANVTWKIYTDSDSIIIQNFDTSLVIVDDYVNVCYSYSSFGEKIWCCRTFCLYQFNATNCLQLEYAGGLRRKFIPNSLLVPEYYEVFNSFGDLLYRIDGHSSHFTFPQAGRYQICMLALNPCCMYEYCCIEICIADPSNCETNVSFAAVDESVPLLYSLSTIADASDIRWYLDHPNGTQDLLGSGAEIEVDFELLGGAGTYAITTTYFDQATGCYTACCRIICIENSFACDAIHATSHPANDVVSNYTLSLNGSSEREHWVLHLPNGNVDLAEDVDDLTVDLSSWIADNGNYLVSVCYWNGSCWRYCIKEVCVVVRPIIIAFSSNIDKSSVEFILQSNTVPDHVTWDFGDGNSSTLINPVHQYNQRGAFEVCCTVDKCGLIKSICTMVNIEVITAIENEELDDFEVIIYPNPLKNSTMLTFSDTWLYNDVELSVCDFYGRSVDKRRFNVSERNLYVDFDLASGVYILQIESGNKRVNQKLIVID